MASELYQRSKAKAEVHLQAYIAMIEEKMSELADMGHLSYTSTKMNGFNGRIQACKKHVPENFVEMVGVLFKRTGQKRKYCLGWNFPEHAVHFRQHFEATGYTVEMTNKAVIVSWAPKEEASQKDAMEATPQQKFESVVKKVAPKVVSDSDSSSDAGDY
jgi:hypothetical protein